MADVVLKRHCKLLSFFTIISVILRSFYLRYIFVLVCLSVCLSVCRITQESLGMYWIQICEIRPEQDVAGYLLAYLVGTR